MYGNELAQVGNRLEVNYTGAAATHTGPVIADVNCPDGTVTVTVDPAAAVARVRLFTEDGPDSPAADAMRDTRIRQDVEHVAVTVPRVSTPARSTTMTFGGGATIINGVRYDGPVQMINGQVVSGDAMRTTQGLHVHITLPADSVVWYRGESGSLRTIGAVGTIRAESVSGSITAERVGRIEADAVSGSVKVGTVTKSIKVDARDGSVAVQEYAGSVARIRAYNGSVTLAASPSAIGRIDVRADNGSVRLSGVRGRVDLDVRATAVNGSVKKS